MRLSLLLATVLVLLGEGRRIAAVKPLRGVRLALSSLRRQVGRGHAGRPPPAPRWLQQQQQEQEQEQQQQEEAPLLLPQDVRTLSLPELPEGGAASISSLDLFATVAERDKFGSHKYIKNCKNNEDKTIHQCRKRKSFARNAVTP